MQVVSVFGSHAFAGKTVSSVTFQCLVAKLHYEVFYNFVDHHSVVVAALSKSYEVLGGIRDEIIVDNGFNGAFVCNYSNDCITFRR